MPPLINARNLSKRYGVRSLFSELSITVSEGERIGLIGPNGSGKSTLLKILAGLEVPDEGELPMPKRVRVGYVPQQSEFPSGLSVESILRATLADAGIAESEHAARIAETSGRAGFTDLTVDAGTLSGGWRKRLTIASAIAPTPDVLLLDEPTNHLDLAGINWVEAVLRTARFASIIVSHDRYLLENVATSVVELNRIYDGGLFRVNGRYSDFLEARDAFLASDGRRTESLANRVRSEVSWLRRGPKARGTKAQARVDNAQRLIDELGELKARRGGGRAGIDFSATVRRTRRLIELKDVGCAVGGRRLFGNIDLEIGPGTRLGVVGPNGSGKTTLLRLVRGDLAPTEGTVGRADPLRIVYFDQSRDLDPNLTLRRTLAPDQDSVVYQDRAIHVRSWASRFLFSDDDLDQPVGRLSGGERARVLIAQLMLEPADVLLLDEPTNDLDIPTLEVLEDRLNEFAGAMILVTHDRHMMDLVATRFLGFDGAGGSGIFAGYTQWERWLGERESPDRNAARTKASPGPSPGRNSKKLGYMEAREYAGIPDRIEEADARLEALRASMSSPEVATDAERLLTLWADIVALERRVEQLYARWEELQRKQD